MANTTTQAYPWHSGTGRVDDGETAPGGPAMPPRIGDMSSQHRSDKEIKQEYQTLKSAGMPLEGMKLVLNEDVDAINEDATHVLTLNERLTRYALYVSQLERSNKELGAQVETMMAALAAEKQAQKDAQLSFDEERGELLGKVAAAEAQTAVALQKVDEALDKGGASQKDLERANEAKRLADARVKTMEGACDELRQICEDNGIDVPKHLTPAALNAAGRREAFANLHGPAAERMLDAAVANSDSARIALRVAALQDKGIEPPVDEAVMNEMLNESLSPQEMADLMKKTRDIGLEALTSRGIAPCAAIDCGKMDAMLAANLTAREQQSLDALKRQREVAALAAAGTRAPLDEAKMVDSLKVALTPDELRALYANDNAMRRERLAAKGRPLPDSATNAEIDAALQAALAPEEYEALEAAIGAGHVKALAERGVPPPMNTLADHERLLAGVLTNAEKQPLKDAACIDKVEMMQRKGLPVPCDDEKLEALMKMALNPEDYEAAAAGMRHEKMAALAAKGKQVPVDEAKLQRLLEETLTPAELAALRAAEYEASYNSARAALRLEKLLEKGVPLSDELVIACQRGEPWAIAELDRLIREHLTPDEINELLAQEEMVMQMIFEDDEATGGGSGGDGGSGGGRGGNNKVGSSASRGAADGGTITREAAAIEQQSLLIDVQQRMEAEYLQRLAESSSQLRESLQQDLDKEQQARREAQARNLALLDAVENQRARNAELMAKLTEHEARELERLRQLEQVHSSRETELDAFRLQAERAIQDAAEAKAAREQLERAINQYEKILDAIGIQRSVDKHAANANLTTRSPKAGGFGDDYDERAQNAAQAGGPYGGPGGGPGGPGGYAALGGPDGYDGASGGGGGVPKNQAACNRGGHGMGSGGSYGPGGGGPGGGMPTIGPDGIVRDANGQPVIGSDGLPMRSPPGGSIGPEGIMRDRDGNPVIGADGQPVRVPAGAGGAGGAGGGRMGSDGRMYGPDGQPLAEGISVAPALPPHLLQLDKFVLLTDEGPVAVRARFNGTVGYLKRQIATQLHISPRLALTVTASSSTIPLNDDAIISPYAEGQGAERLLLSAAPRPLSDFFPGSASLPAFRQIRVRPLVRGVPQNFAVVLKGVSERTTAGEIQHMLAKQPNLLPTVDGKPADALHLYFSPVFITPDVLLGRKSRQVLKPTQSLGDAQLIDDDIVYLSTD